MDIIVEFTCVQPPRSPGGTAKSNTFFAAAASKCYSQTNASTNYPSQLMTTKTTPSPLAGLSTTSVTKSCKILARTCSYWMVTCKPHSPALHPVSSASQHFSPSSNHHLSRIPFQPQLNNDSPSHRVFTVSYHHTSILYRLAICSLFIHLLPMHTHASTADRSDNIHLHCRRPGILVLINDADWELEGEASYALQANDNILFVSTLHGG